jgi:high-affinity nickel permease
VPDGRGRAVALSVIEATASVLNTIVRSVFSPVVVIVLGLAYAWTIERVPEAGRLDAIQRFESIIRGFGTLVSNSFLCLFGWILAVCVTGLAGTVMFMQHRRITDQGQELARYRDERDPNRVSSRRPGDLVTAVEKSVQRSESQNQSKS